ncbi:hypothetical protein SEA_LIBERTYBELL_72 [Streptomyces phage LibertyBell]|nr:hypothetical protein SEA_LIBERTYBELL_72 [Streptomyces phage LibertyBell]
MTENNLIHVSNTPIFDALMREHNITASLSPNSTLRPRRGLSLVKKPVLPVRAPGATLHTEEPQTGFQGASAPYAIVDEMPDMVEVQTLQSKIQPGYIQTDDNPHVFVKRVSGL